MDRRQFLVSVGRAGLALGVAATVDACARSGLPSRTGEPSTAFSTASPTGNLAPTGSAPPSFTPAIAPRWQGHDDRIAVENRRLGNRGWDPHASVGRANVEGFLDAASVAPGEQITLHLGGRSAVDVDWYRLGWYGGLGGRLVRQDAAVRARPPGPRAIDRASGRAEAAFAPAVSLTVPSGWVSGAYVAVIRPPGGQPRRAPFIVRPAPGGVPAPVLFVSAATTWQAYNSWGGADLYDATTADAPTDAHGRRATQVSFDRPYALALGAGYLPRWELPFIRWQEREGRAVDSCADVDLELHPEIVDGRRLLVFAGHHEYWSRPMRATLERALGTGTNVAFLSANEVFWQVRFEASPLGPARRVVCYKSRVADPITATRPDLTTCRWREQPVDDPEAVIIGQMYGHTVERVADWVVTGAGHWLYEGTGLRDGDHLRNLVGQEFDTFFPEFAPPGTTLLASSPVRVHRWHGLAGRTGRSIDVRRAPASQAAAAIRTQGTRGPAIHNATIYTAESGATVFAAGTFQWSWAIDRFGDRSYRGVQTPVDERVIRMTRNLFDRLGDGQA